MPCDNVEVDTELDSLPKSTNFTTGKWKVPQDISLKEISSSADVGMHDTRVVSCIDRSISQLHVTPAFQELPVSLPHR